MNHKPKKEGLSWHIEAQKGEIASTVLMPGDPLRAKMIAKTFLKNARLVNSIRGMLAYTGEYEDKTITVMGSGMGLPSAGIYSYELFKFYDVDQIIRIGTTGSYVENLKIGNVVLATQACTTSTYAVEMGWGKKFTVDPSLDLNKKLIESANKQKIDLHQGIVYSCDNLYTLNDKLKMKGYTHFKAIAADMESFAIFTNAQVTGKKAASLLTVSDMIVDSEHKSMTPDERQEKLHKMVKVALM